MPTPERLDQAIAAVLAPAPFELSDLGLYCHREGTTEAALRAAERVLLGAGDRPLRTLDFNLDKKEDLAENVVREEGGDPAAYEGIRRPGGERIFRVDHHHDLRSLATESTTPLTLRWLRALHAAGRADVLADIARSRYLADHCDADVLLANHLALRAEDRRFIEGEMADCLAAAALRNDYIRVPPPEREPRASRAFYACVGIEAAIREGAITFADAQRVWLSALEPWCAGQVAPEVARRLDDWERATRAKEEETLGAIETWARDGRLRSLAAGRVLFLDAPHRIDNSDFYLYLALRRAGARPVIQVLRYPQPIARSGVPGAVFKVRSHGGFDLNPLLARLRARFPETGFGGRSAAGGSRPAAVDGEAVLGEVVAALEGV